MKYTTWLLLIVTSLGFFIFGYFIKGKITASTTNKTNFSSATALNNSELTEIREGEIGLINPLLECKITSTNSQELEFSEFPPMRNKLNTKIESFISNNKVTKIAIYLRDLNNGPTLGINEKEAFTPASLTKVPIMLTYYKLAEGDETILQHKLKVPYEASETPQFFKPRAKLTEDREYTVEELIENMITQSDNRAADILNKNLDEAALSDTFKNLGIELINNGGMSELRVKDYATFFRILFNASFLDRKYSQKSLTLLTKTSFNLGLVKNLPQKIVVAHKFGERSLVSDNASEKQLHDCGIIYYPTKPYLLCIMTRGSDFDQLSNVIAEISLDVYNEIDSKLKK